MKKLIPFFSLLLATSVNAQNCFDYAQVKKTMKIVSTVYTAAGVLKSQSCNEELYSDQKRNSFFKNILTPGLIKHVKEGKYPEKCMYQISEVGSQMMEEQSQRKHSSDACESAYAVMDRF